ncbi:MAG: S49 family peptidase, partial [Muribaculaceae bacterium]|nr:S49 family peptidase [Muribaculaceae bacterium]
MLKRFITAMLGSLAAIWISVFLLFILSILFIAVVISKSVTSQTVALSFKEKTVLHIELSGSFSEREGETDIFDMLSGAAEETMPLNNLINAITAATDDEKIEGIFIECKGSTGGLAQRLELNTALDEFKKSGKWVVSYGDSYTQSDYYTASRATELCLNPVGIVDIHGLSATTLFYKGLLDKVGVEMQILKVGTYKSAVEPYILD